MKKRPEGFPKVQLGPYTCRRRGRSVREGTTPVKKVLIDAFISAATVAPVVPAAAHGGGKKP